MTYRSAIDSSPLTSPPSAPVLWDCVAQDPVSKEWRTVTVEAQTAFRARELAAVVFGFVPEWSGVKRK